MSTDRSEHCWEEKQRDQGYNLHCNCFSFCGSTKAVHRLCHIFHVLGGHLRFACQTKCSFEILMSKDVVQLFKVSVAEK